MMRFHNLAHQTKPHTMCMSLIIGYMISREQTDDTLKNILTIPVSFRMLLTGKLIVGGFLSWMLGMVCSLFTIIAEILVRFSGLHASLAIQSFLQISAVNVFQYLAVLPIIVLTSRVSSGFLVGVIAAFVYGCGGMFAAGNMTLSNLYPITASLGLVGYRSYNAAVHWNVPLCACSLLLTTGLTALLVLCTKDEAPTQKKGAKRNLCPRKGGKSKIPFHSAAAQAVRGSTGQQCGMV